MKTNNLIAKILLLFSILPAASLAQLGINSDNSAPSTNAMLDVKSNNKGILIPRVSADLASPTEGLLYYNTTGHNFRYYDGTTWQNALFGNQWNVNGTKISYSAGNVGIGVANPLYKLDVAGDINTSGYITTDGYIGIGGYPQYKLNVFNGSLAITNTSDSKTWAINYNSASNYLQLTEDGEPKVYFKNGGYVGIGVNPVYQLDVAGTVHSAGNLRADGNAYIDGTAVVNGNKGVVYNASSSTNLKIYRFTTPTYDLDLPSHGEFATTLVFDGDFTSTPTVLVGDIDYTFGSVGHLERVMLVLRSCSYSGTTGNTTCVAKLVNVDDGPIQYAVRYNCVAIGN